MTAVNSLLEFVLHRDLRPVSAGKGTPHVWLCDLNSVLPEDVARLSALSVDELSRADRLKSAVQKERFLRSRQVLRTLLAGALEIEPAAIEWKLGPWGKPAIANSAPISPRGLIHFSLAHAEGWLAIAVAWGHEIGVDLEIIRPDINPYRLAVIHFSPREAAELGQLTLPERRERFYQLWTLKEAYLKAQGVGVAGGMQQPEFCQKNERGQAADSALLCAANQGHGWWHCQSLAVLGNQTASLALASNTIPGGLAEIGLPSSESTWSAYFDQS